MPIKDFDVEVIGVGYTGLKAALLRLSQESDLELPPAVRAVLSARIITDCCIPNQ